MAKVMIRYGEIDNEQIVVAAAQSGRFLKEVNAQLKNGFGRNRHNVAQNFSNEAIANVKRLLRRGFPGAGRYSKDYQPAESVVNVTASGIQIGTVSFSTVWEQLAKSTVRQKRKNFGHGRYWVDKRNLADYANSVRPSKVTYTTRVFTDDIRRQGDKDTRLDFEVVLTFGEMDFPFDDLVRRPLVEGEYSEAISDTGTFAGNTMKLAALEYGNYRQPERPWIRQMSAEIGKAMFDELITNR